MNLIEELEGVGDVYDAKAETPFRTEVPYRWKVVNMQINSEGRNVLLIANRDGRSVAMFRSDLQDWVCDRATLDEIMARNKGANLADPWPAYEP